MDWPNLDWKNPSVFEEYQYGLYGLICEKICRAECSGLIRINTSFFHQNFQCILLSRRSFWKKNIDSFFVRSICLIFYFRFLYCTSEEESPKPSLPIYCLERCFVNNSKLLQGTEFSEVFFPELSYHTLNSMSLRLQFEY